MMDWMCGLYGETRNDKELWKGTLLEDQGGGTRIIILRALWKQVMWI
jgi:hypothetical protein